MLQIAFKIKQVRKALRPLITNKSSRPDDMPLNALKICYPQLALILTSSFETFYDEANFPDSWKIARVHPHECIQKHTLIQAFVIASKHHQSHGIDHPLR